MPTNVLKSGRLAIFYLAVHVSPDAVLPENFSEDGNTEAGRVYPLLELIMQLKIPTFLEDVCPQGMEEWQHHWSPIRQCFYEGLYNTSLTQDDVKAFDWEDDRLAELKKAAVAGCWEEHIGNLVRPSLRCSLHMTDQRFHWQLSDVMVELQVSIMEFYSDVRMHEVEPTEKRTRGRKKTSTGKDAKFTNLAGGALSINQWDQYSRELITGVIGPAGTYVGATRVRNEWKVWLKINLTALVDAFRRKGMRVFGHMDRTEKRLANILGMDTFTFEKPPTNFDLKNFKRHIGSVRKYRDMLSWIPRSASEIEANSSLIPPEDVTVERIRERWVLPLSSTKYPFDPLSRYEKLPEASKKMEFASMVLGFAYGYMRKYGGAQSSEMPIPEAQDPIGAIDSFLLSLSHLKSSQQHNMAAFWEWQPLRPGLAEQRCQQRRRLLHSQWNAWPTSSRSSALKTKVLSGMWCQCISTEIVKRQSKCSLKREMTWAPLTSCHGI